MILWMRFGLDNSLDLILEERSWLLQGEHCFYDVIKIHVCCIMEPPLGSKAVVLTGSAESHHLLCEVSQILVN